MIRYIRLLLHFGYQEAMSCLFPVFIFASLALSKFVTIPGLPRYDLLLLLCLLFQIFMVKSGLESRDELKVITVFHVIGLCLEIFKVHMGSWSYPEDAYSKVFGVPLYSGFMYASVASYLCQAWRRLEVSLSGWPHQIIATILGAMIYLNFFTHHYIWDLRWVLMAAIFIVFWKTRVYFSVANERFFMPIPLSYFLIGFFIWIAENIATFLGAWNYPNQRAGWELVHLSKISSWFLLVIVSFIIVAELKHVKSRRSQSHDNKRHI
ncbi:MULTISPECIES: DUF817 domain-containing protein [Brevibacillus]|uniref:DUF817 domain-containing protein n=1 Tax=Brevibacillus porteri TaxID=2126350 RepID=A0ABX5FVG2_9BACL|nr:MULTISPECIES: DUF817 domain-containing protein [Brevibacillus]MDC0763829.1 DUF817 domain-containing protein [Brevibacillus sp. AG]MED1801564.1 DUF817 domain-containing protein [Brevibacillus porteri]MED2133521.1 DUF817 domain-containing protein [Brevibacillus porteri]MED2743757.1 DUF817 domain-containing protein [Brevibacillus porteri]MED2816398.1 DUF817 domain-containing protein [Brevibacillus porteri]